MPAGLQRAGLTPVFPGVIFTKGFYIIQSTAGEHPRRADIAYDHRWPK